VQNIANRAALAISGGLVTNTVINATETNTKVFDTSNDPKKTKLTDDKSNTAILTNISEGKANVPTNLFKPILAA
jgi:flavoprotein